jgi:hypothetical protein
VINFRYHVVSLVAVFLALGTGTLVGSSFISKGTVAVLKASIRQLDESNRNLIGDVRALNQERRTFQGFVEGGEPWIVGGRLTNRPVYLVSIDTTPGEVADRVAETLAAAGARIRGSVQLTSKLDLSSGAKREQVAKALGAPFAGADQLTTLIVNGMASSLAGEGPGLLQQLVDAGLATVREAPGSPGLVLSPAPGLGATVVVLGGPSKARSDLDDRIAGLLATTLASLEGSPVVVGAGEPGAGPFHLIGRLREGDQRVLTADGVDGPMGRVALILGLQAAAEGRFGDYGTGPGASSLLPEPPK